MKRFGQLIGVRAHRYEEYRAAHARIWPEIEAAIRAAGIANYSIFHREGLLFAYFEYVGPEAEYAERMRALAAAPRMREWWDWMEPMQAPLDERAEGEWWSTMEEVFHQD